MQLRGWHADCLSILCLELLPMLNLDEVFALTAAFWKGGIRAFIFYRWKVGHRKLRKTALSHTTRARHQPSNPASRAHLLSLCYTDLPMYSRKAHALSIQNSVSAKWQKAVSLKLFFFNLISPHLYYFVQN